MNQRNPGRNERRHPHLVRCRWHGCPKNAVQGLHLDFCQRHLNQIRTAEAEAMRSPSLLDRCGWVGCVEYALVGTEVKFCLSHIAIVTAHGLKDGRVFAIVEEMMSEFVNEAATAKAGKPRDVDGHVYFLLSDNLVKIGWASDLDQRMKAYSPGARILAVMPGTRQDETRMHRKFADLKGNRREWFTYHPRIMEEVERIVAEHGDPPRDLNEPMVTKRIVGPRLNQYVGGPGRGQGSARIVRG